MDKDYFEAYAKRASEIVIGSRGLSNNFAVVSENYYMEARIQRPTPLQLLALVPPDQLMTFMARFGQDPSSIQSPVYLDNSPVFEVKPDVKTMIKFWLEAPNKYELALIMLDKPTRAAVDSLVDQGVAQVTLESPQYDYRLLESKMGNKLHVYGVPEGISTFDKTSGSHRFTHTKC